MCYELRVLIRIQQRHGLVVAHQGDGRSFENKFVKHFLISVEDFEMAEFKKSGPVHFFQNPKCHIFQWNVKKGQQRIHHRSRVSVVHVH